MPKTHGFSTRAIHAGATDDPAHGDVVAPIHVTTTHKQDGINNLRGGFEYARAANPTRTALEEQLAELEGARHGLSFSSGMAAEDALLRGLLSPGDHVVIGNDVYGGTYRLIDEVLGAWGVSNTVVDMGNLRQVQGALTDRTRVIWVETPSNPLMKITDIAELSEIGHSAGLTVVVDNTFASPALQRPLELGADVVVHSTTKYLGGHSDVLGGAVVLDDDELHERVRELQFSTGAVPGPFDAYLTTRGIKTLQVRMERHCRNAQVAAEFLEGREGVERVYYPGLESHPGHALAAQQMSGFGGMLSVALTGGERAARRFAERMDIITLAESLGGVESLVNYPSDMTHASVKGTALAVPENVARVSIGIEDIDDLLEDLDRGLVRSRKR